MKTKSPPFLFLALILQCMTCFSQVSDPEEIQGIARASCSAWLEKIPPGREAMYGFESRGAFKEVGTADPIRINYLSESVLKDSVASLDGLLIPMDEYRVPLVYRGHCCSFLTLARSGGSWKVVSIGASSLAKEIDALCTEMPSWAGEKLSLLRVYALSCDLLIIGDPDLMGWNRVRLVPLNSAARFRNDLPGGRDEGYALSEMLGALRSWYRTNVRETGK